MRCNDAWWYQITHTNLPSRKERRLIFTAVLNSARSNSVGKIRRRRAQEAKERSCGQIPSADCNKCMDNAVPKAIAEVMVCGVAALAGGALSGGAASVLAATGFLACDAVVYTSYEGELIGCRSYN